MTWSDRCLLLMTVGLLIRLEHRIPGCSNNKRVHPYLLWSAVEKCCSAVRDVDTVGGRVCLSVSGLGRSYSLKCARSKGLISRSKDWAARSWREGRNWKQYHKSLLADYKEGKGTTGPSIASS